MSRVGKLPVAVPAGVDVSVKDGQIQVKGLKRCVAAVAEQIGVRSV